MMNYIEVHNLYIKGVKSDIYNVWISKDHGNVLYVIITDPRKYG